MCEMCGYVLCVEGKHWVDTYEVDPDTGVCNECQKELDERP